ncbi:MAG: tRNA (N6-isopentenyl adenosine(37)-C2)-methylthiotransferase MiaB [Clostridiales bacterium]|nr:tRNA (N6-isopentenyl adenosine(37)-C2)-methylthiotransferase MiaB [Clostridiales bacterium]
MSDTFAPLGTYYITTFGCQMNVRDSQTAAGVLESLGYVKADSIEDAAILLYNTCCIRDLAERKALAAIGLSKAIKEKNHGIVGVFGCMTAQDGTAKDIMRRMPYIDFAIGTHQLNRLPDLIAAAKEKRRTTLSDEGDAMLDFPLPASYNKPPLSYINIIHGCNNFCAYCIVPYVRGREKSKPMDLILKEAEELLNKGYQEITLLGQNVNSYGNDWGKSHFAELLRALDRLGVPRIRFMTSHPKDLHDEVIEAMAECSHVAKQIHLPVQSGSSRILKLMNRKYTREGYLTLVEKLRSAMPDVGITTDLIVGFPTETEEDFNDTLSLCHAVKYDAAFTFNFSKRKGTAAYNMEGEVEKDVMTRRIMTLIDTIKDLSHKTHASLIGSEQLVLIEGEATKDAAQYTGRIDRGITVNFKKASGKVGDFARVRITEAKANTLLGEEIEE